MCLFCDWGELDPAEHDPEAAAERRRVSQTLWAQLMDEIEKPAAAEGPPPARPL